MKTLNPDQRAKLRSIGSHLDPIVYYGKDGFSEAVVNALDKALSHHELVKVRFIKGKDEVREESEKLRKATESQIVSTTGFTTLFFRQDEEDPERIYRI